MTKKANWNRFLYIEIDEAEWTEPVFAREGAIPATHTFYECRAHVTGEQTLHFRINKTEERIQRGEDGLRAHIQSAREWVAVAAIHRLCRRRDYGHL